MTTGWISFFAATLALGGPAAAQTFTSTTPTMTAVKPSYKLYGTGTQYDRVEGDLTMAPTLPALSTGIKLEYGTLTITGGSYADTASVVVSGTNIVARRGGFQETFPASSVRRIKFYGNAGNDTFDNRTSIPSEAHGGDGDDILRGGSGADFLIGGLGNDSLDGNDGDDVLWGSGGHDDLDGGNDDDHLKGHGGDDFLYGGYGNDALYGGSGTDELSGQYGVDTLVAIGGGYDTVVGGTSSDFFWVDTTDWVVDPSTTETNEAYVNKVASFYRYSFDGGGTSTAVPKDLTSFDLADPISVHTNDTLVNYGDRPLFGPLGPIAEDVLQGAADSCFFLGPLGAVAAQTPDSIRKLIVDLDDGTYAVRFFRTEGGAAHFVRVDADLYEKSPGVLRYARPNDEPNGSRAIWLPIVEKAFAMFRNQTGAYSAAYGGNNGTSGKLIMGATSETVEIPALFDKYDIVDWVEDGRPSGNLRTYLQTQVPVLLNQINDLLEEGRPVYTGYKSSATNATAVTTSNWRPGTHIVQIVRVEFNGDGTPRGLVLREQYSGEEKLFTDLALLYHLIGRANTYDMP